ncbi:MAG: hypothetical protein RI885_746 [Actinomycetota bacterium]|jgi:dihydroxyacetone kinase-like protein
MPSRTSTVDTSDPTVTPRHDDALTGPDLVAWIELMDDRLVHQAEWLTELDSAIGDGDHGINLARGFAVLSERLSDAGPTDLDGILELCSTTLVSTVGGAGGALYGTFFRRMANGSAGYSRLDAATLAGILGAGVEGVTSRGMAQVGDKTMVDALVPCRLALGSAADRGDSLSAALEAAAAAADAGRESTRPLVARRGRASYLGSRSADHLDPGAASTALLVRALSDSWNASALAWNAR